MKIIENQNESPATGRQATLKGVLIFSHFFRGFLTTGKEG